MNKREKEKDCEKGYSERGERKGKKENKGKIEREKIDRCIGREEGKIISL